MKTFRKGDRVFTVSPNGLTIIDAVVVRGSHKRGVVVLHNRQLLGDRATPVNEVWRCEMQACEALASRLEFRAKVLRNRAAGMCDMTFILSGGAACSVPAVATKGGA